MHSPWSGAAAGGRYTRPGRAGRRAEPRVHQVEITGFAFVPSRIEARAGDVIAFTNRDFAPHTASADSSKWDTGRLKNGASARVVLNYTGTVPCHCELHLHMKGDVVITGAKSVHAR